MADDDGSYMPLEDHTVEPTPEPTPPVAETPPAEPPPTEPPVETPPDDDDDDLEAKVVEDRLTRDRMVPLSEVTRLREKARARKAEAETLSGRVKELEEKAAQADQAAEVARQWQAYAQSLATRQPDPAQAGVKPDPRQAEREQARQRQAEEVAKTLDLYTSDGKPDVERGLRFLSISEAMAREQSESVARPLRQEMSMERSRANRAALASRLQRQGAAVDTAIFDQLWNHLTPELTANQEVAAVAAAAALGWPLLFGGQAPPAVQQAAAAAPVAARPSPVVPTEPVRQTVTPPPRLTGLAARAARDTGMTDAEVEKRFGRPGVVVLADDLD